MANGHKKLACFIVHLIQKILLIRFQMHIFRTMANCHVQTDRTDQIGRRCHLYKGIGCIASKKFAFSTISCTTHVQIHLFKDSNIRTKNININKTRARSVAK
jgi:hypothetical protein